MAWNWAAPARTAIWDVRRGISMVFQHANLVRRLSALENVLLGRMGYLPTTAPQPETTTAATAPGTDADRTG